MNKYELFQILDENGFVPSDENANILAENLYNGDAIILGYNGNLLLTEGISSDYFFMNVLDENGFVVNNHNLYVLKEAVKNGSVLLTEADENDILDREINKRNNIINKGRRKNASQQEKDAAEEAKKELAEFKNVRSKGIERKNKIESQRKLKKALHIAGGIGTAAGLLAAGIGAAGKYTPHGKVYQDKLDADVKDAEDTIARHETENADRVASKTSAQSAYDTEKAALDAAHKETLNKYKSNIGTLNVKYADKNASLEGLDDATVGAAVKKKLAAQKAYDTEKAALDAAHNEAISKYNTDSEELSTKYADRKFDTSADNKSVEKEKEYLEDLKKKATNNATRNNALIQGGGALGIGSLGAAAATVHKKQKKKVIDED